MKSFLVASAVAIGVAAFTATLPSIAYAQHNHYHGGYGWGWGGFAAGAAADAILGGMLASPYNYGYAYEPAPADAVAYCACRFKSYDPRSRIFLGRVGDCRGTPLPSAPGSKHLIGFLRDRREAVFLVVCDNAFSPS